MKIEKTFDDISFFVVAETENSPHWVNVKAYPIFARLGDGTILFPKTSGPGVLSVSKVEDADYFLSVEIKYDGGSEFEFNNELTYFGSKEEAVAIGILHGRIYDIADELFGLIEAQRNQNNS